VTLGNRGVHFPALMRAADVFRRWRSAGKTTDGEWITFLISLVCSRVSGSHPYDQLGRLRSLRRQGTCSAVRLGHSAPLLTVVDCVMAR
jgi:hypothetical protein